MIRSENVTSTLKSGINISVSHLNVNLQLVVQDPLKNH